MDPEQKPSIKPYLTVAKLFDRFFRKSNVSPVMFPIVDFVLEEQLSSHAGNPRLISPRKYELLKEKMYMYHLRQQPLPGNLRAFIANGVVSVLVVVVLVIDISPVNGEHDVTFEKVIPAALISLGISRRRASDPAALVHWK
ncbi:hypothetical protein K435DRAFT_800579 [Dendrothele bispora CBS 962.96]|uniref:Uncharacterized protein n=1 Tax=Dendrothele bispora (strain CBS 962.96) TaxID=1314807 RepID=A0A4S8LS69_DENBC|nr:hypothetical protein K435DRAFT_800579 [Dendrothele bispora CBS 962.96]